LIYKFSKTLYLNTCNRWIACVFITTINKNPLYSKTVTITNTNTNTSKSPKTNNTIKAKSQSKNENFKKHTCFSLVNIIALYCNIVLFTNCLVCAEIYSMKWMIILINLSWIILLSLILILNCSFTCTYYFNCNSN